MPSSSHESAFSGLTRRHVEILGALTPNLNQRQLATALSVTVPTLRSHLRVLYRMTGTHSMWELRAWWGGCGPRYLEYLARLGRIDCDISVRRSTGARDAAIFIRE